MTGQLASVQNSVMVPYSMLIWLKKSTAGKETHQVYSKRKHKADRSTGLLSFS